MAGVASSLVAVNEDVANATSELTIVMDLIEDVTADTDDVVIITTGERLDSSISNGSYRRTTIYYKTDNITTEDIQQIASTYENDNKNPVYVLLSEDDYLP